MGGGRLAGRVGTSTIIPFRRHGYVDRSGVPDRTYPQPQNTVLVVIYTVVLDLCCPDSF